MRIIIHFVDGERATINDVTNMFQDNEMMVTKFVNKYGDKIIIKNERIADVEVSILALVLILCDYCILGAVVALVALGIEKE